MAIVDGPNCVSVVIDQELELTNAHIKILGENRNLLCSSTVTERSLKFCVETGKPTFVEFSTSNGVVVTYVVGSGYDRYQLN